MHCKILFPLLVCYISGSILWWPTALAAPTTHEPQLSDHQLKLRAKLSPPLKFKHSPDDLVLNQLDSALQKISTVYMQALFSGTHSPELEVRMRSMEIELFDLLALLYKEQRLSEYMKYEREVTRQMIIYSMLKKLFGYSEEENEEID